MNGRILAKKILRIGYYWNTMKTDYVDYVKSFHDIPPSELYNMTSPWPFLVWGIDVIGRIAPKDSNGHEYILVAINYFTKWVEATSYSILKAKHVARFLENSIICQFMVSQEIISDNGSHFEGEVRRVMEEYRIEHHKSSPYRPQANGAIEVANKNVKNILTKMVMTYKDWAEKLLFALWGYKTSIHASTGATPYSLVYGVSKGIGRNQGPRR